MGWVTTAWQQTVREENLQFITFHKQAIEPTIRKTVWTLKAAAVIPCRRGR